MDTVLYYNQAVLINMVTDDLEKKDIAVLEAPVGSGKNFILGVILTKYSNVLIITTSKDQLHYVKGILGQNPDINLSTINFAIMTKTNGKRFDVDLCVCYGVGNCIKKLGRKTLYVK